MVYGRNICQSRWTPHLTRKQKMALTKLVPFLTFLLGFLKEFTSHTWQQWPYSSPNSVQDGTEIGSVWKVGKSNCARKAFMAVPLDNLHLRQQGAQEIHTYVFSNLFPCPFKAKNNCVNWHSRTAEMSPRFQEFTCKIWSNTSLEMALSLPIGL